MGSAPVFPYPGGVEGAEPPDPKAGTPGHFAWSNWIKQFVKNLDRDKVAKSGDEMTGTLTFKNGDDRVDVTQSPTEASRNFYLSGIRRWKEAFTPIQWAITRFDAQGIGIEPPLLVNLDDGILQLRRPHSVLGVQQGVWQNYTPVIKQGGVTVAGTVQIGRYARVGNVVHYQVTWTATATSPTADRIQVGLVSGLTGVPLGNHLVGTAVLAASSGAAKVAMSLVHDYDANGPRMYRASDGVVQTAQIAAGNAISASFTLAV